MQRLVITIVLILCFFHLHVGYNEASGVTERILFAFCHANIFHLLCNLIALWTIKGKLYLAPAFLISFLSTYLPTPEWQIVNSTLPNSTCFGFSAVIFAIIGIKWGKYFQQQYSTPFICLNLAILKCNIRRFFTYTIIPIIITMFIPNINWCIHFYALAIGLTYGFILQKFCTSHS